MIFAKHWQEEGEQAFLRHTVGFYWLKLMLKNNKPKGSPGAQLQETPLSRGARAHPQSRA